MLLSGKTKYLIQSNDEISAPLVSNILISSPFCTLLKAIYKNLNVILFICVGISNNDNITQLWVLCDLCIVIENEISIGKNLVVV